jgi:hypothetical protein
VQLVSIIVSIIVIHFTYDNYLLERGVPLPCITIIDTITLNLHTKDAYYKETYLLDLGVPLPCITIIDTITLTNYTKDAYTYLLDLGVRPLPCTTPPSPATNKCPLGEKHTALDMSMYVCVCMYVCMCMCVCVCMYVYMCVYVCVCVSDR